MDTKLAVLLAVFLLNQFLQVNSEFNYMECPKREGITPEEAHEFAKANRTLIEKNPKVKCFMACLLEASEMIDGCTFQYEKSKEMSAASGDPSFAMAVEGCKDSVISQERCQCGYEVFMCLTRFGEESEQ